MEAMGCPLVHTVILLIDNLTASLEKAMENEDLHISVRAGATAGVQVLRFATLHGAYPLHLLNFLMWI